MNYTIRFAREEDARQVCDIYGAYVPGKHVTFTVENPSAESYRQKILHTLERYPFLVAQGEDGKILGYVYGSPLRPHDAYRWNVEWTIMLAPDTPRRQGIATALYKEFADILARQGYRYIYGVLVDTNEASLALHKSLGFTEVGHFENTGYKLGSWLGIRWLVKQIGSLEEPSEPLKLSQLPDCRERLQHTDHVTAIRAQEEWQRSGAYSVRIQGMNRQHGISLREEFDEHDGQDTRYIVLLDGTYPVATCRFYPDGPDSVTLGRVVVLPEYRGRQLGRRVLQEAESWLRELGCRCVHIESRLEAVEFYRKNGYIQTCQDTTVSGVFDCIPMEKLL